MDPGVTANPEASPPPLAADNLHFGYDPGRPVLTGLTAVLAPGRVTVLLGPNAAGKTTLLRLLLGQLEAGEGSVTLCGKPVGDWPPAARAAVMSYVPQRSSVSFAFTVEQVVSLGRFALPRDPAAVDDAVSRCDLGDLRHRIFSELSFGQQQRVLLARAMAQARGAGRVMLLDEPGSAMDLWHIHQTMRRLAELAASGMAMLVVLHDLNLAARYADDVWLLDAGRLAARGPWREVLRPAVLEPIYRVELRTVGMDAGGERPMFVAEPRDTLAISGGA
jgi:iron complex transport system ATP-binding protein